MKQGDRVRHTQIEAWACGKDAAKQHLRLGETYTVERTEVHSWHTKVWLKEFPGIAFNTVQFEKVSP